MLPEVLKMTETSYLNALDIVIGQEDIFPRQGWLWLPESIGNTVPNAQEGVDLKAGPGPEKS